MAVLKCWFAVEGGGSPLFGFHSMTGSIQPVRVQFERVTYPGADGVGIWITGSRGDAFTLTTECDYATPATANTALDNYKARIATKLDVYRNEVLKGTALIHNVVEVKAHQLATTKGGFNVASGSSSVMLVAQWSLEMLN